LDFLHLYATPSKAAALLIARFLEAAKLMPIQLRRNPANLSLGKIQSEKVITRGKPQILVYRKKANREMERSS
jgi:hypothetical protein